MKRIVRCIIAVLLLAGLAGAVWLPGSDGVLGGYVTSLQGRTRGQRMNATRAARALDGVTIAPGKVFSFNHTVGSWTSDRGYVLAPVSYDGELVVDWGGGVCQTSTVLYNAALIAGLEIVERHRHTWAPSYVPPGRDAAVAQYTTDLRLRNPYPAPVRLHAIVTDDTLGIEVSGHGHGSAAVVSTEAQEAVAPAEIIKADPDLAPGRRRVLTHGRPGQRVAVYRSFRYGPRAGQRELLSQDTYPAMNRIVTVGE